MDKEKDSLLPRPPVVAVVGHVDHGKTALLDYIRKTNKVAKEAGGITQSIGAHEVEHNGQKITFIDTPGHEAFTKMRTHGASVADIAILVVAADDGVKQQTKEALEILRAGNTPFIVAISKSDKEEANIEKIKSDLMSVEVFLEGTGGDVSWQAISSKTGDGVSDLLDLILLMGEVLELKYDPDKDAEGFVIESQKDTSRGNVSHLILKDGTLRKGDDIKTQTVKGKIKILENFLGKPVKELVPSSPASIVGFDDIPESGAEFVTGDRELDKVEPILETPEAVTDESEASDEEFTKVILKADTQGSIDALKEVLKGEVEVVESSAGDINDNDIKLAKSTGSVIVGFEVKAKKTTLSMAEIQGVTVFTSKIIYELLDALKEFKTKEKTEFEGGQLEILALFNTTSSKQTVGGKVLKGVIRLKSIVELTRGEESFGKGRIKSLQTGKEEVNQVGIDTECGLMVDIGEKIQVGDILKIVK